MQDNVRRTKTVSGTVVNNKSDKTVAVSIERMVKHPMYGKYIRKTSKVHAHDEENKYQIGDIVKLAESKPYSKIKKWKVIELVGSNK